MGSGGSGGTYYSGGNGGGAIKIVCNSIEMERTSGIYCNGSNGDKFYDTGGGSGGSIYIVCTGNSHKIMGSIHAKGGKSKYSKGGDGRIRINCQNISYQDRFDVLPKPFLGFHFH